MYLSRTLQPDYLFFFFTIFIYLFIYGCVGSSFLCEGFLQLRQAGALFIAVCGPLIIAASLVAEHRLQTRRLSNCGSRAQLLRSMWDPPRPGLEPVYPALAGRFSTTAPPGKPQIIILNPNHSYFTPLLKDLHWLPTTERINSYLSKVY